MIVRVLLFLPLFLLIGCGSSSTDVSTSVGASSYARGFINSDECDVVIDKVFLTICYDNGLKAAKAVAYGLDGTLVNQLNITDRPLFYSEPAIDVNSRAEYSDYTNSGYDRGHLAPDASFDWSQESLDATYSLANIIPQVPEVNQHMWVDVENYERSQAVDLGAVNVINIVKYSLTPTRIGANQIAVSEGYYKVLYKDEYQECFYYANDVNASSTGDTLTQHQVSCGEVGY